MHSKFQVLCADCQKNYDKQFIPFCEDCGGITEVFYDLENVVLRDSKNPYERFQDLLPVRDASLFPTDTEYTPTVHAKKLGEAIGLPNLYLKNETVLPTGTTKDRMAATAMAYLKECGVKTFCTSSTGNSSTAYSRAMKGFDDFKMYLFTAEDFHDRVQFSGHPNIVHYVMRDATFTEAFNYGGEFAQLNGFVPEKGFFNLGRREGLKITWMEAVDQVDRPIHWYVQAISSAMGVFGTYKAAKELYDIGHSEVVPRLLCCQQESCSPMATAWSEDSETIKSHHVVQRPSGIAKAILRGDPTKAYPFIRKIVKESEGEILAVSEAKIREARQMVNDLEGIDPCFSASTAIAGLIKAVQDGYVPPEDTVLINLTGSDREVKDDGEEPGDIRWLYRTEDGWKAEDPQKDNGLNHSGNK